MCYNLHLPLTAIMAHWCCTLPVASCMCTHPHWSSSHLPWTSSPIGYNGFPRDYIYSPYQQALKLLQDPPLPIYAYGLLLLCKLVGVHAGIMLHRVGHSLKPTIRNVFLQAIQNNNSYMFSNAILFQVWFYSAQLIVVSLKESGWGSINMGNILSHVPIIQVLLPSEKSPLCQGYS